MSLFQTKYNGHAGKRPGKREQGGLFAVIEDGFYKSKQGAEYPDQSMKDYSEPNQVEQDSFYLYSSPETVSMTSKPEYQTILGYSKIMDARLGIEDYSEPKISKYDGQFSQVSLASGFGTDRGQEYPHRPNLSPTILQMAVSKTKPPRKFNTFSDRNSIRKSFNSGTKAPIQKKKTTASKPYFKTHKDRYDPFAFQSTQRSKTKHQSTPEKSIFSNKLDSRFSIQVLIRQIG